MLTVTAAPIAPKEPVLVLRTVTFAVLRYQTDNTASTKPEGVFISSPTAARGAVAIREVIENTGVPIGIIG